MPPLFDFYRLPISIGRRAVIGDGYERVWFGALCSVAAFSLAHLPFWGPAAALFTAVSGGVLAVLYVWKRNLAANMIAHALTATVQLAVLAPPGDSSPCCARRPRPTEG